MNVTFFFGHVDEGRAPTSLFIWVNAWKGPLNMNVMSGLGPTLNSLFENMASCQHSPCIYCFKII